jgi:IclR family KDG regulon transcriptional repressor
LQDASILIARILAKKDFKAFCILGFWLLYWRPAMPAQNYISVLEKGMRVLEAFRGEREVPLGELAARTGQVKSSVFRILFTLERLGYVEKQPRGRYSVTARLARIAGEPRPSVDLINLASPHMAGLLGRFQETVNLGVLDGGEVLYVHVLESSHTFRLAAHAGMRSPIHSTALGKCLVSRLPRPEVEVILKRYPLRPITPRTIHDRPTFFRELEKVRRQGFAVDNEEDSRGVRCMAAPIPDPEGIVRAAISISAPVIRLNAELDRQIAEAVREACGRISRLLGYTTASAGTGRVGAH